MEKSNFKQYTAGVVGIVLGLGLTLANAGHFVAVGGGLGLILEAVCLLITASIAAGIIYAILILGEKLAPQTFQKTKNYLQKKADSLCKEMLYED